MTVVGVLSDTHGHLHPKVRQLLTGADHIVHAGDVGSAEVLAELRTIAPVTAVRGNADAGDWAQGLPAGAELELDGVRILVGHVAGRLKERTMAGGHEGGDRSPEAPSVLISGHTHLASVEMRGGVLHLNPGSAGPRRFGRPRTVARLEISAGSQSGAAAHAGVPEVTATILPVES